MFIRVADRQFDPCGARLLPGAPRLRRARAGRADRGRAGGASGRRASAWLRAPLARADQHGDAVPALRLGRDADHSSLAAILQAAAPIFTVLIAVALRARAGRRQRAGGHPRRLRRRRAARRLARRGRDARRARGRARGVLLRVRRRRSASRKLTGTEPLVIAAGSCVVATVLTAPFGRDAAAVLGARAGRRRGSVARARPGRHRRRLHPAVRPAAQRRAVADDPRHVHDPGRRAVSTACCCSASRCAGRRPRRARADPRSAWRSPPGADGPPLGIPPTQRSRPQEARPNE